MQLRNPLILLLVANILILTGEGSVLRMVGAFALCLLPGLVWIGVTVPYTSRLVQITIGTGLSYAIALIVALVLHYLPGAIALWHILVVLNVITVAGLFGWAFSAASRDGYDRPNLHRHLLILMLFLVIAAFFRLVALGYSEFQGDEIKAMVPAARALEGFEQALIFQRKKGPAEILLPMLLWRLSGTTTEAFARLPFAFAGIMTITTGYLAGMRLSSVHVGLVAGFLLVFNGFLLAFSRIVQYQAIVIWMSALAMYCAWQWCDTQHNRWAMLAALFLGAGLLAHFDAVIVVPALIYIAIVSIFKEREVNGKDRRGRIWTLGIATVVLVLVTGLFFVPYFLSPQANVTGAYLGSRIGAELIKNKLEGFIWYSVLYNSFYYVALLTVLLIGWLIWTYYKNRWIRCLPGGQYWVPAIVVLVFTALLVRPMLFGPDRSEFAAIIMFIILMGAFLSPQLSVAERSVVLWFSAGFIGYNFLIGDPRTHIYTVMVPWILLAALTVTMIWGAARSKLLARPLVVFSAFILGLLIGGYLFMLYLRTDVEYVQDWPASRSTLYWAPEPYASRKPTKGLFGFVHRSGWKAVGALFDSGDLEGTFATNEKPEIPLWYAPTAVRTNRLTPDLVLIADDLVEGTGKYHVDPAELDADYGLAGRIQMLNQKGISIYQLSHSSGGEIPIEERMLENDANQSATPATFLRSPHPQKSLVVDFGNDIHLIGYSLKKSDTSLSLILYWDGLENLSDQYFVFTHLEGGIQTDSPGGIWGQSNKPPGWGTFTPPSWYIENLTVDPHFIEVNPDTPAGTYTLLTGLFRPDNGQRLDILDEAGNPSGTFVILEEIAIE
ncbi:MAG: phospholipid carrier-dependent glycosyltransferase [Chloroflexi bacterium]|nr:phospholipid carrier-dependent glycosyltransferase [Chloroflexota bacterium]